MKNYVELPEGYKERLHIDLQKDKKLAFIVNALGVVAAVVMYVLGHMFSPSEKSMFDMSQGMTGYWIRFGSMIVGMFAYLILHELVHGIFMKHFSGIKPSYGYSGLYAYAGSKAYFKKSSYIIIALAPVVIWGIVLLILNVIVPAEWFWVVYIIQMVNVSGACGDLYVTARFAKLPEDILINDTGVSMTIYSKEEYSTK